MIKTIEMYTVICDGCGKDVCGGKEYSAWGDVFAVEDIAQKCDWIKHEDKHYCTDCYEYDDNDELEIKQKTSGK
jgi:hypothetical protein